MFLVIIYDYKINTVQKTTGDSGFFMPVYRGAASLTHRYECETGRLGSRPLHHRILHLSPAGGRISPPQAVPLPLTREVYKNYRPSGHLLPL